MKITKVKEALRDGKRDVLAMVWAELVTSGNEKRTIEIQEWDQNGRTKDGKPAQYRVIVYERGE